MVDDASEGMILLDVTSGGNGFDRDLLERFGHAVKVCHGPDHATLGRSCAAIASSRAPMCRSARS